MRNRGKRLAALLGAAALVICQNGVMEVRAEEVPASEESQEETSLAEQELVNEEESLPQEETSPAEQELVNEEESLLQEETSPAEQELVNEEESLPQEETSPAEQELVNEEESMERTVSLQAAENLDWKDGYVKGYATFTIPNEKGAASYKVDLWRNGERYASCGSGYSNEEKGTEIELFLFHSIQESGTYKFQVTTLDMDGKPVNQAFSSEMDFKISDVSLPIPSNGSWDEDGIFSCARPDSDYFLQYVFVVFDSNNNQAGMTFGSPVLGSYIISENEEGITFDLKAYLKNAYGITVQKGYSVMVQATSRDAEVYKDSKWSGKIMFGNESLPVPDADSDDSSSDEDSREEKSSGEEIEVVYEEWKPTTADEIKRYAVYSREKAEYTAAQENDYAVEIRNAMQGKQCFDSFEAVLNDWVIGRTYNILPAGGFAYKMDTKARITLNIPRALQKEGREFRMICVTEKGRPVILNDVDTNSGTITFETDTYYAFALIYNDTAAAK